MLDTKGPSMLTGSLKEGKPVELQKGQVFMIVTDTAMEGDASRVSTNYAQLPETVQIGSIIQIDNGALECEVIEVQEVSPRRDHSWFYHFFLSLITIWCSRSE